MKYTWTTSLSACDKVLGTAASLCSPQHAPALELTNIARLSSPAHLQYPQGRFELSNTRPKGCIGIDACSAFKNANRNGKEKCRVSCRVPTVSPRQSRRYLTQYNTLIHLCFFPFSRCIGIAAGLRRVWTTSRCGLVENER
jgi:hypothetical protein